MKAQEKPKISDLMMGKLDREDMEKKIDYLYMHASIFLSMSILYLLFLFRPVPSVSRSLSYLLFAAIEVLSLLCGYLLHRDARTNSLTVWCNTLFGLGVYTFLCYAQLRKTSVTHYLIVIGAVMGIYALLLSVFVLRSRKSFREKLRLWLDLFLKVGQLVFSACSSMFMLVLVVLIFLGRGFVSADRVRPVVSQDATIVNNMDMLCNLQESVWEKLPTEERLDVLQTIANIECRYLGLSHELHVAVGDVDDGAVGGYDDSHYQIKITPEYFTRAKPFSLVNAVCHESYHAYQYDLIRLYDLAPDDLRDLRVFRKAQAYEDEFRFYDSTDGDETLYYTQECETDARDYASTATEEYYNRIKKYVETGEL
ncbi:MAG: DMT family transporter [Oscillospiraceae bacterium]|nr:DMT family transporter [Oscillospiraceae bacterium]